MFPAITGSRSMIMLLPVEMKRVFYEILFTTGASMAAIVIKQLEEERLEIYVNGILVGNYSQDDDGWDSLEKAEELAAQIGYALGLEVIRL